MLQSLSLPKQNGALHYFPSRKGSTNGKMWLEAVTIDQDYRLLNLKRTHEDAAQSTTVNHPHPCPFPGIQR